MVETEEGHRNFRDIAAVKGLAAIRVGPFDLSVSMGLEGNWRDERVQTAVREMIAIANEAGHRVVMPVFAPDVAECREQIAGWRELDVHIFVMGSDKIIVAHAFKNWVDGLTQ